MPAAIPSIAICIIADVFAVDVGIGVSRGDRYKGICGISPSQRFRSVSDRQHDVGPWR